MQLYTREETIRKINHLGQSCRPFIFIINYLQDASYIEEVASVDPSEVVYNLNGFTNQSSSKDVLSCFEEPVHWNSYPESFDSYRRSFDIVQRNIFAGNSFLTNLTCRTPIETNLSLKIFSSVQKQCINCGSGISSQFSLPRYLSESNREKSVLIR